MVMQSVELIGAYSHFGYGIDKILRAAVQGESYIACDDRFYIVGDYQTSLESVYSAADPGYAQASMADILVDSVTRSMSLLANISDDLPIRLACTLPSSGTEDQAFLLRLWQCLGSRNNPITLTHTQSSLLYDVVNTIHPPAIIGGIQNCLAQWHADCDPASIMTTENSQGRALGDGLIWLLITEDASLAIIAAQWLNRSDHFEQSLHQQQECLQHMITKHQVSHQAIGAIIHLGCMELNNLVALNRLLQHIWPSHQPRPSIITTHLVLGDLMGINGLFHLAIAGACANQQQPYVLIIEDNLPLRYGLVIVKKRF